MAAKKKTTKKAKRTTKTVQQEGSIQETLAHELWEDLGFSPEEAQILRVKADLHFRIVSFTRQNALTQHALSKLLDIPQPRVSNILRGKLDSISIETLLGYALRLDQSFVLQVVPRAAAG